MSSDSPWLSVPANIEGLTPYEPGKPAEQLERELGITDVIKVASNENPLGPSPLARAAAVAELDRAHLYPDGSGHRLRHALAERLGVAAEEVALGAGSNELIHLLVRTFCRPGHDQIVTHENAFVSYRIAGMTHGVEVAMAPVKGDLRADIDALCDRMGARTRLVFVANPNNPTGHHLARRELEALIERTPAQALLVIDEAYHEYARALVADWPSSQSYREGRPSLITLRTFSKIYGLAGLRVGYAVADRQVVAYLNRVRRPFHVSAVAQAAAIAALGDEDHVVRSIEHARKGLARLRSELGALGLDVVPSATNFVLVGVGRTAGPIADALASRGIIVRPMAGWGLPDHFRLSLPDEGDLDRVIESVRLSLA